MANVNMNVISTVAVTDAVFTGSNIDEDDHAEWDTGTPYVTGDYVIVTSDEIHRVYKCLLNNTGHFPPDYTKDFLEIPEWSDEGRTNRWRMHDDHSGDQTSNPVSIVNTYTPGKIIDSLAFFNIDGASVRVVMTVPGEGDVYDRTVELVSSPYVVDEWTWCFSDFAFKREVVMLDLPAYSDATITMTITARSGQDARCGHFSFGQKRSLGYAVFDAELGNKDFSIKDKNQFGNSVFVPRKSARTMRINVRVPTERMSDFQQVMSSVRNTPCPWIGAERYGSLQMYGWVVSDKMTLGSPQYSPGYISVEELS